MTATFVDEDRDDRVYFKVANSGSSAAFNVCIEFDDSLSSAEPSLHDYGSYLRRMYRSPGVTLGPGESVKSIYQSNPEVLEPGETIAPDLLTGTISYFGPAKFSASGVVKKRGSRFIEGFSLDAEPIKHMVRVSRSDRDVEQRLKFISASIDKGAATVAKAVSKGTLAD